MHTIRKTSSVLIFHVLMILVATGGLIDANAAEFGVFDKVEYIECYDGDTCRFNIPGVHPVIGKNISIRLAGIDTPEIRGKCYNEKRKAKEAKDFINSFLNSLSADDRIDLQEVQRGKYFRLVAVILVYKVQSGQIVNLNNLMLEKGYAVRYEGRKKNHDWCVY